MTTVALLTLRTSVVLLAALAACVACRRHSAALRHALLSAGVGAALLVVPLTVVLPSWDVLPIPAVRGSTETPAGVPAGLRPAALLRDAIGAPVTAGPASADSPLRVLSAERVALGVWLLGFLTGVGVLLTGVIRLARVSSRAVLLTDDCWVSMTAHVAGQLGLSRPVRLLSVREAAICTWGVARPSIVVPAHAIEWPDERIRTVLCHELGHVSRGDWGMQIAASLLRSAFWFNPLTWMVYRRLRDEAERACDDVVLRLGTPESVYAGHLLDIARSTRTRAIAFAAAMSMARSSTLEGRVAAMLNTNASRNVPSRAARAAIITALVATASGAAALGLAAQSGPLSLHGSIYDSSGAVLPAVEMTLTNDRGIRWTTPTDGEGKFEFTPVGPGEYELEATMRGFTPYRQKVTLDKSKDWNRVITLQVGQLEETISVTAQRPKQLATASAPAGTTRVRVGGNIKPPTKLRDVRPTYPESMRAAGLEGTVPLETVIGKDGTVVSVRLASAQVHPDFARAAIEAVEQWVFSPTLLNGRAVEVTMTASIWFSLQD